VHDPGKIVRPLELDLEAGGEGLFHQRQTPAIAGYTCSIIDFAVIDRICERDHAGKEHVVRRKFARLHDVEAATTYGTNPDLLELRM